MANGNKNQKVQQKSKSKQKDSFSTNRYVLVALAVAVCAFGIYFFKSDKSFTEMKKDEAKTETTENKNVEKQDETQKRNVEQKEEEQEQNSLNNNIPTLLETRIYNQNLSIEANQFFSKTYNLTNETETNDLIFKTGMLFHDLETKSLSLYIQKNVNNPDTNKDLQTTFMGVFRDDFYCVASDFYHFTHEEEMYSNITLFSDWSDEYTRKDLFGNFSHVASPMYGAELKSKHLNEESFALELNINSYYLNRPKFVNAFLMGQQFGCLFQGLNKIPSSGSFTRKEGLARTYRNFIKQINQTNSNPSKKYSEKCMKEFDFLPQTYNLNNKNECVEFFQYVTSQAYATKFKQEGFQFISKLGANVHQGKGINVVTQEIMDSLIKKYDKGSKCGVVKEENPELVQGYINDPLLLNGVKFEIRMHFVVASVNPLIIYAQDKAGVAFCALKYSAFDPQIQRHLCVYNIAKRLLSLSDEELLKISGKTREQFMGSFSYQHTLETLQVALEKEGSVPPGWISNTFTPSVYRNYIHTVLMARSVLVNDQRFYEMYAPDILINKKNMQPYILEYNTNPRMVNTSYFVHDWNLATIKDIVLINMSYVRSRFYRIKKIVDEYVRQLIEKKNPDKQEYLKRLLEANINKLEPQFNVDDKITSYVKIYDETDPKDLYYKGNLIFNKECSHSN